MGYIKYVNTNILPKWEDTENVGKIKWSDCVGLNVDFVYNGLKGKIKIMEHIPEREKLIVQYLDNEPLEIITTSFKSGLLGNIIPKRYVGKKLKGFKIGQIVDTNNNGKIEILSNERLFREDKGVNERAYKYRCLKCNQENTAFVTTLSRGVGCPVCNGSKIIKGYNDIATLRPDLVRYFCNENDAYSYGINSHINLWFKCPECESKRKIQAKLFIQRKFNCPMCDDTYSIPNKIAYNILSQLDVDFEAERMFDWCRYKKYNSDKNTKGIYDFYFEINDKKYVLEMDGLHHKIGRQGRSAEEQNYIDTIKDKLAIEHGIKVIRIECFKSELKYIKENIYKSELKYILDLDKIDWQLCKNIVFKIN